MIILPDGDIIAYRCSASAENDPEDVAFQRIDDLTNRLIEDTQATGFEIYLGSKSNWRKQLYPEYKANRKDTPKPKHLNACIAYLRDVWKAQSEDGLEGDDLMSIRQHECLDAGIESVIASIDKDMFQVPGNHYQWEISGAKADGTRWVKEAVKCFISPLQGLRRFYGQVISGDGSDNIPSFDGKVRSSVPKFIQTHVDALNEMTEETEMYEYCKELFNNEAVETHGPPNFAIQCMNTNASVLYLLKRRGELWKPPL